VRRDKGGVETSVLFEQTGPASLREKSTYADPVISCGASVPPPMISMRISKGSSEHSILDTTPCAALIPQSSPQPSNAGPAAVAQATNPFGR